MKFKLDGVEMEAASDIRVRELVEAESALGFSMDETGSGGKMAIALFVAMRRLDPEKAKGLIADTVMAVDLSKFEEVEEEEPSPPAPDPEDGVNGDAGLVKLQTSGRQPSASSV
jgi:hypothetical protein